MESITSLLMIFIMIIPGVILSKKNHISPVQAEGLTSVVANVTWPCLVIDAMQIPFSPQILRNSGYAFVVMTGVFLLAFVVGTVILRWTSLPKSKQYILIFMLIFANTGFMGIPIINALYGKEAIFYASVIELVNDVFLFTVGIVLIQLSLGGKKQIRLKNMLSPGLIGVFIGFLLFLFSVDLPGFLGDSIAIVGQATTPLSMIIIGLEIGKMSLKGFFTDRSLYVFSLVKLLIIPGVVWGFLLLSRDSSLLGNVLVMDFAMPAAVCTTIFTKQYKGDVDFATKGVLVSTVLSILTLPLITLILSG